MNARAIPWIKTTARRYYGLPGLAAALAFVVTFIGVWQFFFRTPPVEYGDASRTHFNVSRATEGDAIEICFDDIVWRRVCPSYLVTNLTPARGPRLDLPRYRISAPAEPGRVPPKCRKWTVPELGAGRAPGIAVLSGYVESQCSPLDYWYPIRTPMPTVKLDISKK